MYYDISQYFSYILSVSLMVAASVEFDGSQSPFKLAVRD
jgi:hypothetical protein